MATTIIRYLAKCEEVVRAKPKYVRGQSNLQECDCIGMDKYAFRECGVSFSTTGTNFTVRQQVNNLRAINSVNDLSVGDVVFKAYEQWEDGWALEKYPKYMPGGKYYNGDLRDYYHIGTVKSVHPLEIIHMTSPTAKTDSQIGKWKFVAEWKKEFIIDSPQPEPAPEPTPKPEPEPTPKNMIVTSGNGKPVNMRKSPSLSGALVTRVPDGETVEWLKEDGAGWAYIRWNNKTGWMMDCYLEPENPEPYPGEELIVWADNGRPVKLRARPSTSCNVYDLIPCGTPATLVEPGEEWSQVDCGKRKGWYMMTKFLSRG